MPLWLVWICLSAASLLYGGALWAHWLPCLAAILVIAAFSVFGTRAEALAPPLAAFPTALLALPVIAAIGQLIPLPESVIAWLAPARSSLDAQVSAFTGPGPRPLSLLPAESFRWTLTFIGLISVFWLGRQAVWRRPSHPWLPMIPLVALGSLQAALGLAQHYLAGQRVATGTYVNQNHFAFLLEISLPFALFAGTAVLQTRPPSRRTPIRPALAASALFVLAGLMLAAIVASQSRAGFGFALASMFLTGILAFLARGRSSKESGIRTRLAVGAVALLMLAGFVFLPADPLVQRFANLAANEDTSGATRIEIWTDTIKMIRDYPVTGVGLGAYGAAIHQYQTAAPLRSIGWAHNDYLQLTAELGIPIFLVLLAGTVWILRAALSAAVSPAGTHRRYLGLACTGALGAAALHSLVDFNLYIPVNAAAVAWVGGVATALAHVPTRRRRRRTSATPPPAAVVIDAEPRPS